MKFLSSLDEKDRRLLIWSVCIAIVLAVTTGFLLSSQNDNDNPLPSTYFAGKHGARAAYETLLRSNYSIERWERPLSELADTAGSQTVVIFAQPFSMEPEDTGAIRKIVGRGGRVLLTGNGGGFLLPGGSITPNLGLVACKLEPQGLDALANSGEAWMVPEAAWQHADPSVRVQFNCGNKPVVVEYDWGQGHVVWWAASTPLENGSITRAHNLDLLLNSLGPREGHHFYWDESLHGATRSTWSYASGPSLTLLWIGLALLSLLVVMSFSRRSGPVRDLPLPPRASPIEFLEALGSLYRKAGAASTAVSAAWERFRRHSLRLCGQKGGKMNSADLAVVIRRRFPLADDDLEADLAACETAASSESIDPRQALKLVQTLDQHSTKMLAASRPSNAVPPPNTMDSNSQERAS